MNPYRYLASFFRILFYGGEIADRVYEIEPSYQVRIIIFILIQKWLSVKKITIFLYNYKKHFQNFRQ